VRVGLIVLVLLLGACSHVPPRPREGTDPEPEALDGIWHWGTAVRARDAPFLRISHTPDGEISIETKHYMHERFVDTTRGTRLTGHYLQFTYWYEPRRRYAACRLVLATDANTMSGVCQGEVDARHWGWTPVYLWRVPPRG
jgi:hypothetical protein